MRENLAILSLVAIYMGLFFMRNFQVKRFLSTAFALCVMCACAFLFLCQNACKLNKLQGERTFYLQTSSSQARQTERLKPLDIFFVQGESVQLSLTQEEQTNALVQEILKEYNAVLVSVENACGVISYYAFSPDLYQGVVIEGEKVNLHIAVRKTEVAVGSPIIFGGF